MPGDDQALQRALELAYRHLDRRDRTIAEIRTHLERHGTDAPTCEEAIKVLLREGFLDDARYVRLFAEDKRFLEQWGLGRITRALLARGIGRELIDEVLSAAEPEGELQRALDLLQRRFPEAPEERRDRDRALGVLLRKGYDVDLAVEALAVHQREASGRGSW